MFLLCSKLAARGVRVVTNVGVGMQWPRERRMDDRHGAHGEVVGSWRPGAAVRLKKAIGGTADTWLKLQLAYDLAEARKQPIDVKRLAPV